MPEKVPPEVRYYSALVGKTVKAVVESRSSGQVCFGLEFTDGTIAWIDCDAEGNGPGFLKIQRPQSSNELTKGNAA
jgi:hypothetical protein